MNQRWLAVIAVALSGAALLGLQWPGSAQSTDQAIPDGWRPLSDSTFDFGLWLPEEWETQTAFENAGGEPFLIRRRVAFHGPRQARIEIDIWERDPAVSLDRWFSDVERLVLAPQSNALIDGYDAFVLVEPGGCGVPPILSTYIPAGDLVLKLHYSHRGDREALAVYGQMLRSLSIEGRPTADMGPTALPELSLMLPTACETGICPSTCWGTCTFAPVNQGCCGYHPVPYWQCSRECIDDQMGEFLGNCVWWGAYTRRDVGALARGNAENWAISVRNTGQLPIDRTPKMGDIVVHPGSSYNHVAYVVWVSEDRASYKMSDMGWCADCGPVPEELKLRSVDADDEFIHCKGDPVIPTRDWLFIDCPFGWVPNRGFAASEMTPAGWALDPVTDPYLLSPVLSISTGQAISLSIRMASQADDNNARIYFATADAPDFDEGRAVSFVTTNDGSLRDYVVDMSEHPQWQGTITRIRIDPVQAGNSDGSSDGVTVARVRFLSQGALPGAYRAYLPLALRDLYTGPENRPPHTPTQPVPADAATNQPISLTLSWSGGDPDGDLVTYDVYLDAGDDNPETLVCGTAISPTCSPGPLQEGLQYSWQVFPTDEHGATAVGPVWTFDTHVPGCTEGIRDGGFETGTDWEIPATPYPAVYSTAEAHSGNRSMRVGIVDLADNVYAYSSIRQLVTVPPDATRARLRFWLYSDGAAGAAGSPDALAASPQEALACADSRYLWVLDANNRYIDTLLRPSDEERVWTYHEVDLLDYADQSIKLQFGACNDGLGSVAGMYVDDVSLELCSP